MSEQKLPTKALHAGHDTSLSQGTRAVQFINLHRMFSIMQIMLQIYLHLLNLGTFIQD